MTDDLERKGPEDPTKINVHQAWELAYWCKKFGVSEATLKKAVGAVGTNVSTVKIYLGLSKEK